MASFFTIWTKRQHTRRLVMCRNSQLGVWYWAGAVVGLPNRLLQTHATHATIPLSVVSKCIILLSCGQYSVVVLNVAGRRYPQKPPLPTPIVALYSSTHTIIMQHSTILIIQFACWGWSAGKTFAGEKYQTVFNILLAMPLRFIVCVCVLVRCLFCNHWSPSRHIRFELNGTVLCIDYF